MLHSTALRGAAVAAVSVALLATPVAAHAVTDDDQRAPTTVCSLLPLLCPGDDLEPTPSPTPTPSASAVPGSDPSPGSATRGQAAEVPPGAVEHAQAVSRAPAAPRLAPARTYRISGPELLAGGTADGLQAARDGDRRTHPTTIAPAAAPTVQEWMPAVPAVISIALGLIAWAHWRATDDVEDEVTTGA